MTDIMKFELGGFAFLALVGTPVLAYIAALLA